MSADVAHKFHLSSPSEIEWRKELRVVAALIRWKSADKQTGITHTPRGQNEGRKGSTAQSTAQLIFPALPGPALGAFIFHLK